MQVDKRYIFGGAAVVVVIGLGVTGYIPLDEMWNALKALWGQVSGGMQ